MIGSRIKDLKEDNDLYQKDIAKVLGVSRSIYSLWEIGAKNIPLKHLNHLCNFYDVSMDYVLKLSNKKKNKNIQKINILDKKAIGYTPLLQLFRPMKRAKL